MAESFFATLECELIDRRSWQTKTEARLALFTYIEGWYNPRRRHSALGQISPAKFESSYHETHRTPPQSPEHDLTTVGDCVACATPPVDKSASELTRSDLRIKSPTVRETGSSPQALRHQTDLASLFSFNESLHVWAGSVGLPQFRRTPRAIKAFSHDLGHKQLEVVI